MQKFEFRGRVVSVGKTVNVGKQKEFLKREIVVDDSDLGSQYTNEVPFEAVKDKCSKLDGLAKGEPVSIQFFLAGNTWTSPKDGTVRHFVANRIVDVVPLGDAAAAPAEPQPDAPATGDDVGEGDPDNLPF